MSEASALVAAVQVAAEVMEALSAKDRLAQVTAMQAGVTLLEAKPEVETLRLEHTLASRSQGHPQNPAARAEKAADAKAVVAAAVAAPRLVTTATDPGGATGVRPTPTARERRGATRVRLMAMRHVAAPGGIEGSTTAMLQRAVKVTTEAAASCCLYRALTHMEHSAQLALARVGREAKSWAVHEGDQALHGHHQSRASGALGAPATLAMTGAEAQPEAMHGSTTPAALCGFPRVKRTGRWHPGRAGACGVATRGTNCPIPTVTMARTAKTAGTASVAGGRVPAGGSGVTALARACPKPGWTISTTATATTA